MKIYVHDLMSTLEFKLIGALAANHVGEFERTWVTACSILNGRPIHVDVSGLTDIDAAGQQLIERLRQKGAKFIATPPLANGRLLRQLGMPPATMV